MITKLENEYIIATINSFGAELCSLKLKQDQTEYIWQADPKYWARHTPVLFPIVGRLAEDEYLLGDKTYTLPQHGFARDMEFDLLIQEKSHVQYRLLSNEQTIKNYPNNFELVLGYTLKDKELIVEYTVKNRDDKIMYFSLGAHPGFRCPLLPNECFEDYYLEFSQKETVYRYPLENGLILNQPEILLNNDHIIPLSYDLFKRDALIFKGLKSNSITLKSKKSNKALMVKFDGFPFHGIWTKPNSNAPFICIEPWYGIADAAGRKGQLSDKEGICSLNASEAFSCQFSIMIH